MIIKILKKLFTHKRLSNFNSYIIYYFPSGWKTTHSNHKFVFIFHIFSLNIYQNLFIQNILYLKGKIDFIKLKYTYFYHIYTHNFGNIDYEQTN